MAKSMYNPYNIGERYTIAKKKKGFRVINDGICGYYVWDTYGEAKNACKIINTCKIKNEILFKTEKDASFFEDAETDYSEFASFILSRSSFS